MALFSNLLLMVAENSEQVLNCFKNGGGISYASFKKFHKWMNEFSSKRHEATLLNNFIPSIKGAFIAYWVYQKYYAPIAMGVRSGQNTTHPFN